jgi:hypothetical protein
MGSTPIFIIFVSSNLAKIACLSKKLTYFDRVALLASCLSTFMPAHIRQSAILCQLIGSFITPSTASDINETVRKQACLSSPMSPHAMNNLRVPVIAETVSIEATEDDRVNGKPDAINNEVEHLRGVPF